MVKKLLFLTVMMISLSYNGQILFKVTAPSVIAANYDFTYTSDPGSTTPWGGVIANTNQAISGDLQLIAHGTGSDSLGCTSNNASLTGKVAVIYRGSCTFYNKIKYAQDKGAIAVVIINNVDGAPIGMSGGTSIQNALITIPAIQISKIDGALIRHQLDLNQTVSILLGNLQGHFTNNLSIYKDYATVAKSYATPQLTAKNSSEVVLPLKLYAFNSGSNAISAASATVTVKKGNQILHTETATPQALNTGDTAIFTFADYPVDNVALGKYTIIYSSNTGLVNDDDHSDDTLKFDFEITDNIYSLAPLSNGVPVADYYTRSGSTGLTQFKQCMRYSNANAGRIGAEGMYFGAKTDSSSILINMEEFNLETFKWSDVFGTPFSSNFDSLDLVDNTMFNIPGEIQGQMIYVPFRNSIPLENNAVYLFCLTPTNPKISIGYNSLIDYTMNNIELKQSAHPFSSTTTSVAWYSDFTKNLTPAYAIKTADVATLGITTSSAITDGYVYPNPTNDKITISLKSVKAAKLTVTDITGKVVMNSALNLTNGNTSVNINALENGLYIFNITTEDGKTAQYNVVKN